MSNLTLKKLEEIIDFKNGKAMPGKIGNIPAYGGNGILGYTDKSNFENVIVVGRVGAYCGSVHIAKSKCWVSDNAIAGVHKIPESNQYNFYLLSALRLNEKQIGSSQPLLTQSILNNIKVNVLDDPKAQQKVATVLSRLDDKIELNNKINAELEALAKTIYDYWFVQFDFPDENGKPYKSSGGKMVWNEELKREIPEGWIVTRLGDFCDLYQPHTISEKDMIYNGKYQVFGANGVVGRYNQYNHADSEIVVTCRGNTCGNITRTYPFCWITGNAMVVKPKDKAVHNEYIYWLLQIIGIHKIITGSAQPQITRTNLSPINFVLPEKSILNKYATTISKNVQKRLQIIEENQKLIELRDWLLPMLMNGQVKVSD